MDCSWVQEEDVVKLMLSCLQVRLIVYTADIQNTMVWLPLLPLKMVAKVPLSFAGVKFSQNRAR